MTDRELDQARLTPKFGRRFPPDPESLKNQRPAVRASFELPELPDWVAWSVLAAFACYLCFHLGRYYEVAQHAFKMMK